MNYVIKETFTAKRNTQLFSWIEQINDENNQMTKFIKSKLGNDYNTVKIYPPKRKKLECPTNCGNTYVWIKEIYTTADKQKQILYAQCANTFCEECFLVYQENVPE